MLLLKKLYNDKKKKKNNIPIFLKMFRSVESFSLK